MTFNKQSGCVKVWVTLIVGGTYTYNQVPKLLNLKDEVKAVLVDMGVMEESTTQTIVE